VIPLDQRCVHAVWALADRGDEEAFTLAKEPIEILYAFAVLIVSGEDKSEFALRILAEAIAARMEGS